MPPTQVFISYRRDDSAGYARAIYDALSRAIGDERVFIDVDDIRPGLQFVDVLKQAVGAAPVLLVLIGPRWQGPREGGPPRLHDAGDMVRHEVATGLRSGARLIPVLLDGTPMPTAAQLPDDLRALPGRNALELSTTRYAADMQRLVHTLQETVGPADTAVSAASASTAPPQPPQRRLAVLAAASVVGATALTAGLWWRGRSPQAVPVPVVDGTWQADVTYDWPGARHTERLVLRSQGGELQGSASFLGVPRGLLEGRVDGSGLQFITRSSEQFGDSSRDIAHRYRARWDGDTLRFVMQTEGASTPHGPIEFVARRVLAP